MKGNYTVLHLHSMLSNAVTNIDSVTPFDDYIKAAKEAGMKALAFTEHGSVLGWIKKKDHIEEAGMKYIHGIEAYITEKLDPENKIRDNYHCVLLAKNYDGVKEINRLSSHSFNREDGHYFYNPRITFDELINTSKNVIITSACLGGILNKGSEELQNKLIEFFAAHNDRCFLEIQHHNCKDQIEYNKKLWEISKKYNIRLTVGTDTHALNDRHVMGRKILQKAKNINFPEEEEFDIVFKTYDQLIESYKIQNSLPMDVVMDALNTTNNIADMVEEFKVSNAYKYPHLWEDEEGYFKKRIKEGIVWRGVNKLPNFEEYKKRINEEYKTYKHNGAISFMLLMDDIISWCKTKDIEVGYGRGSVNGSVIAYLLGITEMDAIKFNLNFQRFMNVERVSLADIDTDFPPSRIQEVKEYIFNKHGLYCCDIVTFNTIADKGAVRDVARALNIPLTTVSKICDALDDESSAQAMREKYSQLFEYVDIVKGTVVSIGNHPCGLVVSPIDVEPEFGTLTTSTDVYPVSQINMKEIDGLNYVKLDLLKLDTIEVINNACKLAKIERLTPDNIDTNDVAVWNSIRDNTIGIFQWEGNTGDRYIKDLLSDENIEKFKACGKNVDRMTLLTIGNSAIRPAGASYREDLSHGVIRTTGAKPIDEFLSNTFGYLVFQCQIIDFLHLYCGFTMGQADIIRRGFAKKLGTDQFIPIIKDGGYMPADKNHEKYIPGYIKLMKEKYGIPEEKSEEDIKAFIQVIEDASSYLFSNNHSTPYSFEGYVAGWLRYHYPLEFLTAALNVNEDKEEKTKELSKYALSRGIEVLLPRFGYSRAGYFFDKNTNSIYKGIASIKFMNATLAEQLYSLKDNEYKSFMDLLRDINDNVQINSRQLDILIDINYFEQFGDINYLREVVKLFNLIDGIKEISKKKIMENNLDEEIIRKYGNETAKKYTKLDSAAMLQELVENVEYEPIFKTELIANENKLIGLCKTTDPTQDKHIVYVQTLDVGKVITTATTYCVNNGKTCTFKIWSRSLYDSFDNQRLHANDVIFVTKFDRKNQKEWNGKYKADGKKLYEEVPDKYDNWLTGWQIVESYAEDQK